MALVVFVTERSNRAFSIMKDVAKEKLPEPFIIFLF